MGTITGFTAERMLAIENDTIVDGTISGNNLILTTRGGTNIDAGNVRGATGAPGVTQEEFEAGVSQFTPAGMIVDYIGTVAPTGWLIMQGQTIVNGQTAYPNLWAVLPSSMKSGSSIVLPDTRGRISAGYNASDSDFNEIGKIGGAKTVVLSESNLPPHAHSVAPHVHSIDHDHAPVQIRDYSGTWNMYELGGNVQTNLNPGYRTLQMISPSGVGWVADVGPFSGNSGTGGPTSTGNGSGSATAFNKMPPYIAFAKMIKVG